ncbi:hypothetical protein AK970_05570 [Corynebacterium pseudotuberculosis]|uniref:hypothetical protein n=1 Tax=Corynebacterium pseudotuberculosis TaxID=1719 RepID=UPI000737CD78|nr:hypothetical protein [Corynebacterium pseudotuberculosis]ALU19620.1 hypothetical protein AK970_05570 [Corynebacterium pseudotuberculosis]
MKLLSRKALVSVVTATAVAAGSLSAPAIAEDKEQTPTASSLASLKDLLSSSSSSEDTAADSTKGTATATAKKKDATKIFEDVKAWVGIISAVLGILTTIITFSGKIDRLFSKK